MDDVGRHGIGGNVPPSALTPLEVARTLSEVEQPLLARRDELLAGVARFRAQHAVIEDDETQGHAGDFVKQLQAAVKVAKDHFVPAKKPFLDAGRAVDAFFKTIVEPLEQGLVTVRQPMDAFALKKEAAERARRNVAARLAAEEANRQQAELARQARGQAPTAEAEPATLETAIVAAGVADQTQRAAAAPSADLTRTRGDHGSVSSLRDVWDVELLDITQVPAEFLLFNEAAARKALASGKLQTIPGVRAFTRRHVVTR